MRKRLVRIMMGVITILFFCVGGAMASSVQKPILLQAGKESIQIDLPALTGESGIFIPVDLIEDEIYGNASVDSKQQQLLLNMTLPRVSVGNSALDRLLFSRTVLALPYQSIDGVRYVEASSAGKLLGFTIEETDVLTIKMNQYGSFAPLLLKSNTMHPAINGQKINLAWQPTFEAESNLALNEKHVGLNVVSPSWLEIVDEEGLIKNKVDMNYVKKAHEKGYQVWALITNSFDPDLTSAILKSPKARKNVIKQLLIYARLYELDGINLDFENIYDADRDELTAFVREITASLHQINVTVSMDVTVPSKVSQWSSCYDRKSLGEIVDYLMVMAYDEHWRTSPTSGSVASIGWVEQGIINTLKEVPAEKVVLGVPFYMREWEEDLTSGKVAAKTMTMERAEKTIQAEKLQPNWLADKGQYYFEYTKGDKRYRVWQEDARSIALKATLVEKYQLAGIGAWRKGFEKPEIWNVIHESLKTNQPEKAVNTKVPDHDKKDKGKEKKK